MIRLRGMLWCGAALLGGCMPSDTGQSLLVGVTGRNYFWEFTLPGPDGRLGTGDDLDAGHHLLLPAHHSVTLQVTSADLIYTLRADALALLETAVPELTWELSFRTTASGRHELPVDPLCSAAPEHPNDFMGYIDVVSREAFATWLAALENDQAAGAAAGSQ